MKNRNMKKCALVIVAAIAALSVGGCFGKGKAPPPVAPPVITKG
jgi:hypothetical protein